MPKRKALSSPDSDDEHNDNASPKQLTAREKREQDRARAKEWARREAMKKQKGGDVDDSIGGRRRRGRTIGTPSPPRRRSTAKRTPTSTTKRTLPTKKPTTRMSNASHNDDDDDDDSSPEQVTAPPAKKRVKLNSGKAAAKPKLTKKEKLAQARENARKWAEEEEEKKKGKQGTPSKQTKTAKKEHEQPAVASSPSPAAAKPQNSKSKQTPRSTSKKDSPAPAPPVRPNAAPAPAAVNMPNHASTTTPVYQNNFSTTEEQREIMASAQLENAYMQQHYGRLAASVGMVPPSHQQQQQRPLPLSPEEMAYLTAARRRQAMATAYGQQATAYGQQWMPSPDYYPMPPGGTPGSMMGHTMNSPPLRSAAGMQSPPMANVGDAGGSSGTAPVSSRNNTTTAAAASSIRPPPAPPTPPRSRRAATAPAPAAGTAAASESSSAPAAASRPTTANKSSAARRRAATSATKSSKKKVVSPVSSPTDVGQRAPPAEERGDATVQQQDDVEREGHGAKELPWLQVLAFLVAILAVIVIVPRRESGSVQVADEQVQAWLPPCFFSNPYEEDQVFENCDLSKKQLDCPNGGLCSGGELKSCIDSYRQVSQLRDECVVSAETNETLAKVEALVADWTIEHTCSVAGCVHVVDHPDSAVNAPFFDVSALKAKIDVDTSLLSLSDSLVVLSGGDDGEMVIGLTEDYLENHLVVPTWCYLALLAVGAFASVVSFFVYIGTWVTGLLFTVTMTYPLVSGVSILSLWAIYAIFDKRRNRKQLAQDVAIAREITYGKLVEDVRLDHYVIHMRDEVAMELYPESKSKRAYVIKKVWPRVVADIKHDNRVLKTTKLWQGTPRDTWQWAATSTTPSKRNAARM